MVDLTLLNEIAQLQAHLDQINMTSSMWMSVGIVMAIIGIVFLIIACMIFIYCDYDDLTNQVYTILILLGFAFSIIGFILIYHNWYDLTYTRPILENQIENLKAMAGI